MGCVIFCQETMMRLIDLASDYLHALCNFKWHPFKVHIREVFMGSG